jgi:hypothetical protein
MPSFTETATHIIDCAVCGSSSVKQMIMDMLNAPANYMTETEYHTIRQALSLYVSRRHGE